MKKIFKYIFLTLCAVAPLSCTREITVPSDAYVTLGEGIISDALTFDWKGTVYNGSTLVKMEDAFAVTGLCPRIDLYSNLPKWTVAPKNSEDTEWTYFWPASGEYNGKFFVSVDRNLRAETRNATINICDHNGKVWKTFQIFQTGSDPYLSLDMAGVDEFSVSSGEGSFTVRLNTNANYVIKEDTPDWLAFSDFTKNSFTVNYSQNPDDAQRSAEFTIACADEKYSSITTHFTIVQRGAQEDFSKAQKISILDLKNNYSEGSIIDANLYIEGTVTSDKDKANLDQHCFHCEKNGSNFTTIIDNLPLWMQDESGEGICIEFITAEDNVYPLGSHFQFHVNGMLIDRNDAGVLRLAAALPDRVFSVSQQAVPEPVEVTDLSEPYLYEDRLVTLKNVQITVPYGTYYNADNRRVAENYTAYPAMLDETSRESAQLLFDKNGNTLKMVSSCTFLDRHCRLMPLGIGDVTGIITRRRSKGEDEFYIRLRSDADNKISDELSANCAKVHVRFGPFDEILDAEEVRANEGSGTLKTSVFTKISTASSTTSMYYVYSSKWMTPFENVTINVRSITPTVKNQYSSINSQQWYNATGTTLEDAPGEAWIITTSTLHVGEGTLYLAFSNASYGSGPKDFVLEWSTDEATPVDQWNKICNYEAYSWSANWQTGDFLFRLPDDVKGLSKIVFRHRVTSDSSVNSSGGKISSSGTNRTNYWALIEF